MASSGFPWLTALIVLPLVGAAVVWLLPGRLRAYGRVVAVLFAVLELALAVAALLQFDTSDAGTHQLVEQHRWIPAFGVSYAVGVDGVGLGLVLLSAVLVPAVLLAAYGEVSA